MKNPISTNWYADPEARLYGDTAFIYVTNSLPFRDQRNLDLLTVRGEEVRTCRDIVDMSTFPHVTHAVWAPTVVDKNGKYYLIFASNNIQSDDETGGLEIAVSDTPYGPFRGWLGRPLLDRFVFGAQPIDAHLFKDDDGQIWLYFGGWGHCVATRMNDGMDGFLPFENGEPFIEVTPDGYVEGPCMLKRKGEYYFMFSTGAWTNESYGVCVCRCKSPLGPFKDPEKILFAQPPLADGPGHHGYLELEDDRWKIVYHRRIVGDRNANHRLLCIDDLLFDESGRMLPVTMT